LLTLLSSHSFTALAGRSSGPSAANRANLTAVEMPTDALMVVLMGSESEKARRLADKWLSFNTIDNSTFSLNSMPV
jgi:fructose-specific component phosphotransferase system IIB-like protein